MPSKVRGKPVDDFKGKGFNNFSRSETVSFLYKIKINDYTDPTLYLDLSLYKVFVSFTAVTAVSCAAMTGAEFQEAELIYTGTNPEDSDEYFFAGSITDEQTIQLPHGVNSVVGAAKLIDPLGESTFMEKSLLTVSECRNPRLDQV